jgi:hypothetical protein
MEHMEELNGTKEVVSSTSHGLLVLDPVPHLPRRRARADSFWVLIEVCFRQHLGQCSWKPVIFKGKCFMSDCIVLCCLRPHLALESNLLRCPGWVSTLLATQKEHYPLLYAHTSLGPALKHVFPVTGSQEGTWLAWTSGFSDLGLLFKGSKLWALTQWWRPWYMLTWPMDHLSSMLLLGKCALCSLKEGIGYWDIVDIPFKVGVMCLQVHTVTTTAHTHSFIQLGSCYVAQTSLELWILPQPPECLGLYTWETTTSHQF